MGITTGRMDFPKPMNCESHRALSLPDNYEELVSEAIQLKREVPSRSVAQIILILEMEGLVPPGVLKRSTMQRYLYKSGFGWKNTRMQANDLSLSNYGKGDSDHV